MGNSKKRKEGRAHLKTRQETTLKLKKHQQNLAEQMKAEEKQPIMYEWAPDAKIVYTGQEHSIINNFIKAFENVDFNTGQLSKHQIYAVAIMQNKLRQMIEQNIALPVYNTQEVASTTESPEQTSPTVNSEATPEAPTN